MLTPRSWIARLLAAALLALAFTTSVHALALLEDCDNCVDDDGDGLVDRKDPDCTPPADGMHQNIGDVSAGKELATCAKAVQKAGFKFILGSMKQFQKCTEAAATCIQAKPGDAACQAKATATCAKALGGFDASAAKLQAVIVAKCDPDGTNLTDLKTLAGLGFMAEEAQCTRDSDVADLSSIQNLSSCIAQQHFCRAQHLVAIGTPRARELLTFAGRPTNEFACIDEVPAANGGGAGVAADHVKKLLKCGKTIDKLAQSLVGTGTKPVQNCLNAGIACLQVKPQDPKCLPKARAKCAAGFTKLQDPTKGTVAKLQAKLLKACSVQNGLSLADIGLTNGLGLSVQQQRCQDLNDGLPLSTPECFGVQAYCEGGYAIEREVPRARELAGLLGVAIPGIIE